MKCKNICKQLKQTVMNQKLNELFEKHLELMQVSEWKDTPETKELEAEYKQLNAVIREECMECGGLAKLTCNYH